MNGWRRGLDVQGSGEPTAVDHDSDQSRRQRAEPISASEWRRSHDSGVEPVGATRSPRSGP